MINFKNVRRYNIGDFQMGRTIGRGGFGKVKIAYNKRNQQAFAIKILSKNDLIRLQQVDHTYNETIIHSRISHPFIVNFDGIAQDSKQFYMIMELVNGGEMFTYLKEVELLPPDNARFYAGIVLLAIDYLHSKNLIYRDLKPENLLISPDGYLKISDFGFAKHLPDGRTFTICGTPEYIAPQIILNLGHGKAVDWWTLGVFIYEMIAGFDPFRDEDPMGLYKNIIRGRVIYPADFSKDARSLVKHLLVADLSQRYGNLKNGGADIRNHKWFKGTDWDQLLHKKVKPQYFPKVMSKGDVSNFDEFPDSGCISVPIKDTIDPFLSW